MNKYIFLTFATLLFFACAKEESDSNMLPSGSIPDGTVWSRAVIGADGGEVAVPAPNGSISLLIPPGALTSPTEITIYTPTQTSLDEIRLGFEPNGLEFLKPVELKVSLSQELFTTHALTALWNVSELNDLVDAGSEEHRWKRLDNIEIDPSGQSISGEMDHFSTGLVLLGIQRVAYMVIDLPGKYLRPGDGLFVMSAGNAPTRYHWVPGHVGIVNSVNPNNGTTNAGLTVLESTVDGGISENIDGVQINPMFRFKVTAGHLYMGARRPTKPWMTFSDTERMATIAFARSKLGLDYGWLGGTSPNRWTCSELVEAAWDAADRGVFGLTDFFPSPVEMFEKTNYISEITVNVGDEVKIPVYPVVIDKSSDVIYSTGFYRAGNPGVNAPILVSGTPEESDWKVDLTHPYHARTFTWTPKNSDAGRTFILSFEMNGSVNLDAGYTKNFTIIKELKIHVSGAGSKLWIYPIQDGGGVYYTNYFQIPPLAVLGPSSQDHLIDSATGAYPVNPIFQNQVLDNFNEGWLNPNSQEYYGVSLHLSKLNDQSDPPPTGRKTWYYSINYTVPYYTGN